MDDSEILKRIHDLASEEHALLERKPANDAERMRLHQLEAMLDQTWDLLRQRRARRDVGENPDDAKPRSIGTVEGYIG